MEFDSALIFLLFHLILIRLKSKQDISGYLPKLYSNANAQVRKEAQDLACEIYRWMGPLFLDQVKNMKDLKPAVITGIFWR